MNRQFKYLFSNCFCVLLLGTFNACRTPHNGPEISEYPLEYWSVASSKEVGSDAAKLLHRGDSSVWRAAQVPGTVLGALVDAGVFPDPFFGKGMDSIPAAPFEVPWWYRHAFVLEDFDRDMESLMLYLDGVNYRADIWLNGQQLASREEVYGAFRNFELDIASNARSGENVLLVKIYPPQVRDFYMGFVDWAPTPPDHFMGLFRDVRLKRAGKVRLVDLFMNPELNIEQNSASLVADVELHNMTDEPKDVLLRLEVDGIKVKKEVHLLARYRGTVRLDSSLFPQLLVKQPRLWWPNGLGEPELYRAKCTIGTDDGIVLDSSSRSFGIRKLEDYLDERQVRHYKVNGRELLIKAAGWVDDLFLRYQAQKDAAQIAYVKDMNLNALRLEGVWGNNHHLYELCDRNGILLMVGWSCQWEWPDYLGLPLEMKEGDENLPINEGVELYAVKLDEQEKGLLATYFRDQVKWLRHHPSIFTWVVGSDAMPPPDLEKRYRDTLAKYDGQRLLLVSAGEFTSKLSGPSGMKMNGPYQYVPPLYWYEDKKLGGAFGFNSEVGPGPQVPPLNSIKKMMPEDKLWPADNDLWNYHSGRKDFANLSVYLQALNNRYGSSKGIAELAFKAQLLNYEAIRPMFEAHVLNREKATGVVQWMLNSPWPEFYWQLYDYYLMPTGAYFGTKKALRPLQLIYNYADGKVYASNDSRTSATQLHASIKLYDLQSRLLLDKKLPLSIGADEIKALLQVPPIAGQGEIGFLDLRILDKSGKVLTDNFYWLSHRMDTLDWSVYSWFYTPTKQFADFLPLWHLQDAEIKLSAEKRKAENGYEHYRITLRNNSSVLSFFNELQLIDAENGDNLLPVLWEDNYVSLLPHETRHLELSFPTSKHGNNQAEIHLQSVNGGTQVVKLP